MPTFSTTKADLLDFPNCGGIDYEERRCRRYDASSTRSSPSVLGRLLDPDAGHWALHPAEGFQNEREYVGHSLVLRTVFRIELSSSVCGRGSLRTSGGVLF